MRRGFTLIELLAVIVILAVIALIAIPIVIDTTDGDSDGYYFVITKNKLTRY